MKEQTIHEIFENTARRYLHKIAITSGKREITYSQLNTCAELIADTIKKIGNQHHKITGIYLETSIEYVAVVIGILKAGFIFMPIDTAYPPKRLEMILDKTNPFIIVTTPSEEKVLLQRLNAIEYGSILTYILTIDDHLHCNVKKFSGIRNPPQNAPNMHFPDYSSVENGGYLLATSGSTGVPKSILGNLKGLYHYIKWQTTTFDINQNDRVSFLSAVIFDVSLRDIFVPLCVGGTLCIPDRDIKAHPSMLVQWLKNNKLTVVHIVPTLFRLITQEMLRYNEKDIPCPSIKHVLIAGEKLYGHDILNGRKALGNRVEFVNLYGPSETTLAKLYYRIKRDETFEANETIPIGKPIPDTDVWILLNGKCCAPGVPGEIYIKTDYRSHGYFNDPELNQAAFIQNPTNSGKDETVFKTGDVGEYMADGNIKILGRVDHQIKLNGIRIELEDIEVALRQHENVREVAVVVKEDLFGNSRLIAYVVPKNKDVSVDNLRNFTKNNLPFYMIPSIFVELDEMPVTYTNKINRKALPDPPRTRPSINEPFLPPSGHLEKKLCEAWREILDIDQVGINDNFFDLGGTSLLIARLADHIGKITGRNIPVVKLFQYPNITLFTKYLCNKNLDNQSYDKIQNRANKRKIAIQNRRQFSKRVAGYGQPEF